MVYSSVRMWVWLTDSVHVCACSCSRYKGLILVLTFCCYASYHLSRKPTSVVKVSPNHSVKGTLNSERLLYQQVSLCPMCGNCSNHTGDDIGNITDVPGWAPFSKPPLHGNCDILLHQTCSLHMLYSLVLTLTTTTVPPCYLTASYRGGGGIVSCGVEWSEYHFWSTVFTLISVHPAESS